MNLHAPRASISTKLGMARRLASSHANEGSGVKRADGGHSPLARRASSGSIGASVPCEADINETGTRVPKGAVASRSTDGGKRLKATAWASIAVLPVRRGSHAVNHSYANGV